MRVKFFAILTILVASTVGAQTFTPPRQTVEMVSPPAPKVGNNWSFRITDGRNGLVIAEENWAVVEVSGDRVTLDFKTTTGVGGKMVESPDSNVIEKIPETGTGYRYQPNSGRLSFPLQVGKEYGVKTPYDTAVYKVTQDLKAVVVGWEQVTVPAGTFRALKIVLGGFLESKELSGTGGGTWRIDSTVWYAPEAERVIKLVFKDTYWGGRSLNNWNIAELVSYKLAP